MSRIPDNPSFEPSMTTLLELSQKVSRIASTLANLATQSEIAAAPIAEQPADDSVEADVHVQAVRDVILARRLRARFFDGKLFADPVWDMLLELFHAEISKRPVLVTALCMGSAIPPATALRWVKVMTEADLIRSYPDLRDPSRIFIELSATASAAMQNYFRELGRPQPAWPNIGNDPQ